MTFLRKHERVLDLSPKPKETNAKVDKWHLVKPSFCTQKETFDKTENKQLLEWENIFVNDMTNKRLISKIHKQLMQLNIKQLKESNQKMAEDLTRHFSKEDIQMAKRHVKRCSTLLILREIRAMKYHLTYVRMDIIKKNTNNKCRRECGERRTFVPCCMEYKLMQPL